MSEQVLQTSVRRIDGRKKVTGAAHYAADIAANGALYGHLVTATIAKGRIRELDATAAEAAAGVVAVLTADSIGSFKTLKSFYQGGLGQASFWPLTTEDRRIRYAGQVIAMVVAETLEAARGAAGLVQVSYAPEEATAELSADSSAIKTIDSHSVDHGDFETEITNAAATVEQTYTTPPQHHNPMELFATTAEWRGDELTLYLPSQAVTTTKMAMAQQFDIPPDSVRVISPYVGGAFGSKATVASYITATAAAARQLRRPVKLYVTRQQMYTVASFRPASIQKVRLGADAEGHFTAYGHEEIAQTSRFDDVVNPGTEMTQPMYAFKTLRLREKLVPTDVNSPGFMRAPNEYGPFFALESAIDELAVKLKMDPVELRLKNDTQRHPVKDVPFSSRSLKECYQRAAQEFGWSQRIPEPKAMTEGDELIGYGCATATYPTLITPASARVRYRGDRAVVELAAHDVGTGAYTVLAQVAAAGLGLEVAAIDMRMGDSNLPVAPIAGGSTTTAGAGSAIHQACEAIKQKLIRLATESEESPFYGADPHQLKVAEGDIVDGGGQREALTKALERQPEGFIEELAHYAHPDIDPKKIPRLYQGSFGVLGPVGEKYAMFAFGAEFVEVRVNRHTGAIRVPRMVGSFAAGKILNQKTGHSQLLGGMIWGLSSALHEVTHIDTARARFLNTNIAEYLIPVNADVQSVKIAMVDEQDDYINPLGAKGIGELGIVGTAAAIANAVYHATGKRLRKLPIRPGDLVG